MWGTVRRLVLYSTLCSTHVVYKWHCPLTGPYIRQQRRAHYSTDVRDIVHGGSARITGTESISAIGPASAYGGRPCVEQDTRDTRITPCTTRFTCPCSRRSGQQHACMERLVRSGCTPDHGGCFCLSMVASVEVALEHHYMIQAQERVGEGYVIFWDGCSKPS